MKYYQNKEAHQLRLSIKASYLSLKRAIRPMQVLTKIALFCILFGITITGHAQQRKYKKVYHALEVSFIGLQITDTHLTYKGLDMGAREINPAAKWMIDNNTFIPIKAATTGGFLYACRIIHKESPKMAYAYLIGANLLYGAVVYNNYQVTLRLKM